LRQNKQIELIALLLSSRFSAEWFQTRDLKRLLSGHFSKTAEIRYQMGKLLERGLLEKRQHANYYRVTKEGYVWLYVAYSQNRFFANPLLSKVYKNNMTKNCKLFDKLENAINDIYGGLNTIYQHINIAA
jgi:repressor of nif and glnA expression